MRDIGLVTVGINPLQVQWSRDWWRHVTLQVKVNISCHDCSVRRSWRSSDGRKF